MPVSLVQCSGCVYSAKLGLGRICRRYPPGITGAYVPVSAEGWCGEYRARIVKLVSYRGGGRRLR